MNRVKLFLKKYFIPHHENEYKPHFLRHKAMLFVFMAVMVLEFGFLAQAYLVFDKTSFLAAVLPGVLESMTNDQRAENNLPLLTDNALLNKAAQLKANDMASKGYFAHTSPEGKSPWYWFGQVGYKYTYAGENLAVNFFESADVARAWMNSPTHRANIVKKDFTEIGIGIANGKYKGRDSVFVAQLFGTPLKATATTSTPKTTTQATAPKTVSVKTTPAPKPAPAPAEPTVVATAPEIVPTNTEVLGEEVNVPVVLKETNGFKSFMQRVLSSPRQSASYVYVGIIALLALALSLAVFIRSEIQHPSIIARGAGLIAVVVLLLILNVRVLGRQVELPEDNLSANVIVAN